MTDFSSLLSASKGFGSGRIDVPEVSEKESFTPSMSWTTNVTWTGQKWRVGNMLYVEVSGVLTGTNTQGTLTFTLPDSLNFDSTILAGSENNANQFFGTVACRDSGSDQVYVGSLGYSTSANNEFWCNYVHSTGERYNINSSTNAPITFDSTDLIQIRAAIPISGWNNTKKVNFAWDQTSTGIIAVPEVSEKESFTPSVSGTSNVTWSGLKWRVGNMLHMQIGGVTSGALTGLPVITLPDSLVMDETIIPNPISLIFDGGLIRKIGIVIHKLLLRPSSNTTIDLYYDSGSNLQPVGVSAPVTLVSGDNIFIQVAIPISGWNTSKQINVGKIPAMFSAKGSRSTNQAFTGNVWSAFQMTTEDYDDNGLIDIGTDNTLITVPAGCDRLILTGFAYSDSSNFIHYAFRKNGTDLLNQSKIPGTPSGRHTLTSPVLNVTAGDEFEFILNPSSNLNIIEGDFSGLCWNSASPRASAFKGALVKLASAYTGHPATTYTAIPFDAEEYDTDGFHDNTTNNTRLTIPAGISKIRLTGNTKSDPGAGAFIVQIYKNGAEYSLSPSVRVDSATSNMGLNICSPVLNVIEGDYFELNVFCNSGKTFNTTQTWFSIEVIE
jgi:hypothetical protein